jgi:hypothetical protein
MALPLSAWRISCWRRPLVIRGICVSLSPALHLLGVKAPFPVIGTEFCGVQTGRPQHHGGRVRRASTIWALLCRRHHLPLQSPGLTPFVESDHLYALLHSDSGHALTLWRAHSSCYVRLDGLDVGTHRSSPQAPWCQKSRATTFLIGGAAARPAFRISKALLRTSGLQGFMKRISRATLPVLFPIGLDLF